MIGAFCIRQCRHCTPKTAPPVLTGGDVSAPVRPAPSSHQPRRRRARRARRAFPCRRSLRCGEARRSRLLTASPGPEHRPSGSGTWPDARPWAMSRSWTKARPWTKPRTWAHARRRPEARGRRLEPGRRWSRSHPGAGTRRPWPDPGARPNPRSPVAVAPAAAVNRRPISVIRAAGVNDWRARGVIGARVAGYAAGKRQARANGECAGEYAWRSVHDVSCIGVF